MGPRSFNRGNEVTLAVKEERERQLQWGRGLSTAEMNQIGQVLIGLAKLQWGRGLSTAEICSQRRETAGLDKASMGPRSFNRGNAGDLAGLRRRRFLVSMGPRSFNRGNPSGACFVSAASSCFNGAAVFQPRKFFQQLRFPAARLSLQWGRGLSTAEMPPAAARSTRPQ